jgi:hypothetical protein
MRKVALICAGVGALTACILFFLLHSKGGQMLFGLSTLNNPQIVFYGKLEDQFGKALGNTPVDFDVRVNSGFRIGVDRGTVVSDANGYFKISGYRGARLFIVPHVAGYAIASENRDAIYSSLWPESERAHPDPKNPVVIKMWKLQGAEPLSGISKTYKLHYTNQPIYFDLLTGAIVSNGGDIKITVNRPAGIISQRNPQVWSVKFEAVDGGLMDSSGTETITYSAPETGYLASRTILSSDKLPTSGPSGFWTGFYVKSRNGQVYTKLAVDISINENPDDLMHIGFGGIANTNSSRNWEGASGTYKPQ